MEADESLSTCHNTVSSEHRLHVNGFVYLTIILYCQKNYTHESSHSIENQINFSQNELMGCKHQTDVFR